MLPDTIDGVIERLGDVVQEARREGSRFGYFAALYRRVTLGVKEGVASGRFEDGPRMERFDIIFANRYLDALDRWRNSGEPNGCWATAFRATESRWPLVIQHLLLGMNAHINLDLGIAAAETCPGEQLPQLKSDFDEINRVLYDMVDDVQERIAVVSPWMGILDRTGGRADEAIVNFSLIKARDAAWAFNERLASDEGGRRERYIERVDRFAGWLGRRVRRPGPIIGVGALLARTRESKDVREIIDTLA